MIEPLRAEDYPVLAAIWDNDEDDAVFSECATCGHPEIDHSPICAETGEMDGVCSACIHETPVDATNHEHCFHEFSDSHSLDD